MQDKELQNTLTLLALVILIDHKVHQVEVETLGRQLTQIYASIDNGILVEEQMAMDWFQSNRQSLTSILGSPNRENYIKQLLTQLSDSPSKLKIYDAMLRIAYSDAEYHKTENELIKQAARLWNIDLGLGNTP